MAWLGDFAKRMRGIRSAERNRALFEKAYLLGWDTAAAGLSPEPAKNGDREAERCYMQGYNARRMQDRAGELPSYEGAER